MTLSISVRVTGKPHIVYMSYQVAAIFRELKRLAGDSELVLPGRGRTTRAFAKNALNQALDGLTFEEMEPLRIHDLRRTGATLLTEKGFNQDVIEKALSHERKGIRAVYIIAEYADQRKEMLQFWANFVEGLLNESKLTVGLCAAWSRYSAVITETRWNGPHPRQLS